MKYLVCPHIKHFHIKPSALSENVYQHVSADTLNSIKSSKLMVLSFFFGDNVEYLIA